MTPGSRPAATRWNYLNYPNVRAAAIDSGHLDPALDGDLPPCSPAARDFLPESLAKAVSRSSARPIESGSHSEPRDRDMPSLRVAASDDKADEASAPRWHRTVKRTMLGCCAKATDALRQCGFSQWTPPAASAVAKLPYTTVSVATNIATLTLGERPVLSTSHSPNTLPIPAPFRAYPCRITSSPILGNAPSG